MNNRQKLARIAYALMGALLMATLIVGGGALLACGNSSTGSEAVSSDPAVKTIVSPVEDYGQGILKFNGYPMDKGMKDLARYFAEHRELELVSFSSETQFGVIYALAKKRCEGDCPGSRP